MSKLTYIAGLAAALLLTACTQAATPSATVDPTATSTPATSTPASTPPSSTSPSASAATPDPTPTPPATGTAPEGFTQSINTWCDVEQAWDEVALTADGILMPAASSGDGDTALVLLHQTNTNGMCGWAKSRAPRFVEAGHRVVMVDLRGYGRATSTCSASAPPADQVRLVVRRARDLGSTRVVLIGASMGGSYAMATVAAGVDVEAVVDLSGPAQFRGTDITADAPGIAVPALFVFAERDAADRDAVAAAMGAMPTPDKKMVEASQGHGIDTLKLDSVREAVTRWIDGDYS